MGTQRKFIGQMVRFSTLGLVALCLGLTSLSYFVNRGLPVASLNPVQLSELEKGRLAEARHLQQALGNQVWPGWGDLEVPIIVYNESYAFLVGYSGIPPTGWVRMPQKEPRGTAWEVVPGDTFEGHPYYRQRLLDPNITPENFTVLVGDQWAASMQTREYMQVAFFAGFQADMPELLRPFIPYRLVWALIMGDTDTSIGALEHEAFHAFQGASVPARLEQAERVNRFESQYPWDSPELGPAWDVETDLLVRAVRAQSDTECADLVRQFLAQRDQRRTSLKLSPDLIDYEQQREWLEGLAKYAELAVVRAAGSTPTYEPVPGLQTDPDFKDYTTRQQFWSQQIDEATRTAGRSEETRFYYTGFVQAALLDRLLPNWKEQAFQPGLMLEDLLRASTQKR